MSKKKKKSQKPKYKFTESRIPSQIMGGDFDPSMHNLAEIESKITNGRNKDLDKIKVLFISEASYLHTGFSTYMREVLKRLNKNPKLEIAELGAYGLSPEQEPRAADIEWKYYHSMPRNQKEEAEYKADYKDNQFGKWKLTSTLEDFKPDVLLLHRDWWMDKFVFENQLSKKFHIIWMACVDSYPQQWGWLKSYSESDTVMAYSHFGKKVMEEQSRTKLAEMNGITPIDVKYVCQAGGDPNVFKPLNKKELKESYGIDPSIKFIGTVMRNQPRKLFTRLIESFSTFLKKHPEKADNVFLLLHTGIPDVGFNIVESIHRYGVEDRVVFSWLCHACNANGVGRWGFVGQPCPKCKNSVVPGTNSQALNTPNTAKGLPDEKLNEIFNLMDLYIQASICEGDGMPVNEAKMAGVPTASTDYSALYEKNRNGGGIPIKVAAMYTECETMQNRALFDINDLASTMAKVMGSSSMRMRLSQEARSSAVKYYNWDLTAKKWEAAIMDAELKGRAMWENPELSVAITMNSSDTKESFLKTLDSVKSHFDKIYLVSKENSIDYDKELFIRANSDEENDLQMSALSLDSDWVLVMNSGEELVVNNSNIKKETFINNEVASGLILMVLNQDKSGIIDFDNKITQLRLVNRRLKNTTAFMMASSPKTIQILANYDKALSLTDDKEKRRQLKELYAHLGEVIMNEHDKVAYIKKESE